MVTQARSHRRRVGVGVVGVLALVSSCASTPSDTTPSMPPLLAPSTPDTVPAVPAPATTVTATSTTTLSTTTSTEVDADLLDDISWTSVPADVIVPTGAASLDEVTNPINGRRGGKRSTIDEIDCEASATRECLIATLDELGFDVTSGSADDRDHQVRRATAVVQLDAGLPMTGEADDELIEYLGLEADDRGGSRADETREIGTSAQGRPIVASRYGDGPTVVLVVGQTHGDEEGGRRVVLRARSLARSDELTLWVVPTMNPDGSALDTRFLASGADPNRQAASTREQQAVYDFALDVRPWLSVWYHQNYGWVGASGASVIPAQQYQERTGLGTLKRSGDCAKGFMWCPIDDALGSSSILVELPDVLTPAAVQIHADVLLEVAVGGDDP